MSSGGVSAYARERKSLRSSTRTKKDPENGSPPRTTSPIKRANRKQSNKTSPAKVFARVVQRQTAGATPTKKLDLETNQLVSPIKKLTLKIEKVPVVQAKNPRAKSKKPSSLPKITRPQEGNSTISSQPDPVLTPKKNNVQEDQENVSPFKKPMTPRVSPRKKIDAGVDAPAHTPKKKLAFEDSENVSPSKRSATHEQISSPSKRLASSQSPIVSPRKQLNFNSNSKSSPKKTNPSKNMEICKPDVSQFASARRALATTHPDVLIGRQSQLKDMKVFLETNFAQPKSASKSKRSVVEPVKKSLYVSGPPGTGKTTCLKHLVSTLPELVEGQVTCAFINCMALGSSAKVFKKIGETILPKLKQTQGESINEMKKVLEEAITSSKKWILLVLDEIDQLESKCQEVLYTLFEWPYLKDSKLVLVGIANALDLTDRILPRITLRTAIAPHEINFPAYSREEIIKIITSRLIQVNDGKDQNIIRPAAISFLAAKISTLSGDVRKALDVCRRAIELAELEVRKQTLLKPISSPNGSRNALPIKPIDIPQILKIVNEVYCSSVTNSMGQKNSDLPLHQKLMMASLLLLNNHSKKSKEVTMAKLHETYSKVCKKRNMTSASLSEALSMASLLESRGFLSLKSSKEPKDTKLSLRIDEDEIEAAMQDKTLLSGILHDVECISK